ncbi:Myb domain [Phytophthora cactorum]|nr:Myb domain [Phytophthora cactorum]
MISPEVMQELLAVRQVLHYLPESQSTEKGWTPHEQQLFWAAVTKYPQGPWSAIAKYIGTKTTRQAMTHAQKLRQKLKRWNARLRRNPAVGSLMDGVVVTADGNVAVSASANSTLNASYNIPPAASLIPVAPPSAVQLGSCRVSDDVPTELESKDHEQHGIHSTTVSYMAVPVQLRIVDRYRPSQIPATQHASSEDHALPTSIPHELVDELAKSLLEEDNVDDDDTKRTQGDRH